MVMTSVEKWVEFYQQRVFLSRYILGHQTGFDFLKCRITG